MNTTLRLVSAEPGLSRYASLAQALRTRVVAAEWPPGSALPAESQLASEHGVALGTMRRALALLVEQGFIERIHGKAHEVNYGLIPGVIYTRPELASVGKTEEQLKAEGVPYKAGSFPFAANGRAVAMIEPAGFVKVLAHAETDRILGMHLVGANVSELVHEGVLTMEFSGSADDLARICHAHPSLSEVVHDAAMAVSKRAIHKAN